MPKMTLTAENKAKGIFDFPTLKLEKGERARVVAIEETPHYEYVHTMKAPTLENGAPVFEYIKDRKGNDVKVMKNDFIGRHICIGSAEKLAKNGADPDNCPVCKTAKSSDAVLPPQRRFAMHVANL